ncbi:hypothetical protein B0H19DRAFT_967439, partial [Mycena capillaripes]
YPEPYTFRPERFPLDDGSPSPAVPDPEVAFGYGRLCPGRHMSSNHRFITIFRITKAVDTDGREIKPSYEFDLGCINLELAGNPAPLPFKCSIRPRSKEAVSLIQTIGRDEGRV